MYKNRTAYTVAIIFTFILVLFMAAKKGKNSRIALSAPISFTIDTPEQAFAIWQQKGVKGRTLVLFDAYPHMKGFAEYVGPPQLNQWNLIEFSIFSNIIRRIYLVIPDSEWSDFLKRVAIRPLSDVASFEKKVTLTTRSGIPMIAVTSASLTSQSETVLVYINRERFDYNQAISTLTDKGILRDITIDYQRANK